MSKLFRCNKLFKLGVFFTLLALAIPIHAFVAQ